MEEVQNFFNRWNGQLLDFDKAYGGQCMDVYQQFNRDVVGAFHVPNPAAADVWNNYPTNFYTKIPNSPVAVPQRGDVVVWGKSKSLPYGHIAIATGEGDIKRFTSFDQNYPTGSKCHIQEHKYTGVLGWLRPNKFLPKQDSAIIAQSIVQGITDQTRIPQIENKEVQQIKAEWMSDRKRIQDLDRLPPQIETLQQNLLLANSKYTDLKTEYEGYKARNPSLAGLTLFEAIKLWISSKSGK